MAVSVVHHCIVHYVKQVVSLGNPMIGHEVTLSIQRLVKKYGKELPHTTWNMILDILETVLRQLEVSLRRKKQSAWTFLVLSPGQVFFNAWQVDMVKSEIHVLVSCCYHILLKACRIEICMSFTVLKTKSLHLCIFLIFTISYNIQDEERFCVFMLPDLYILVCYDLYRMPKIYRATPRHL